MRIIGGKYKGKSFYPPKNIKARPTTDFAKEGLFNILNNSFNFENVDVLDLFSGTGSLSYEFCSRNCRSVIAIENKKSNARFIEKKIEELNFFQAKVYNMDVFKFLNSCNQKFDIIIADPPFNMRGIERIYSDVFQNNLLTDTSYLIIEHSNDFDFSKLKHFYMKKKYGNIVFSFFDPLL